MSGAIPTGDPTRLDLRTFSSLHHYIGELFERISARSIAYTIAFNLGGLVYVYRKLDPDLADSVTDGFRDGQYSMHASAQRSEQAEKVDPKKLM